MKQNADGTPSRSLRNVDALPLLGGMIAYLRDPLGFLIRTRKRDGDVATFRLLDRKFLFVSDPALIEQVLVKQSARFSKDWFARDLKRVLGEGLLTSEGDFWKRQRRLMSPAFHRERLAEYAAVMVERTERALAEWSVGEERDIHHDFMELTLDIVARTLFSADVEGVGAVIGPALDAVLDWYSNPILVSNPWLMSTPLPAARRHREAIAAMRGIIDGIIRQRRATPDPDNHDLLAMLLAAQDEDGERMTDAQVRDEVLTLFLAGHETTALTLSWTTLLLCQHPEVTKRLREEADAVASGRPLAYGDVPKLVYAEAVVQESMRLHPPAWAIGREALEDFELGGRRYPKGLAIFLSPWSVHRDERWFSEPDRFHPDRWLDGLAKRLHKFQYFPFGGGPRICIGNAFAMMESVLLLSTFARRFEVTLAPSARIAARPAITLRPAHGVRVVLRAAPKSDHDPAHDPAPTTP
ncbi:MAG: cytochrome P450 [Deltaproteobacteria bacterium]|nr:cytochrome P450 [Deltaproteobacteria bacterium]